MVGPFEAFWEYMLDQAIMTTVVNPGLAGAPLFDAQGLLVGIVSLGLVGGRPLQPGHPHRSLPRAARRRSRPGPALPTGPSRAWVGFYPQAIDGGVAITGVVPGGPADKAGLTRGDLLLSVDGTAVGSLARALQRALAQRARATSSASRCCASPRSSWSR